jgi:CHASE3 domain sensor protein
MRVIAIIFIIFLIFIAVQVYYYLNIYKKNENTIKKIESFQASVTDIEKNKYMLDDSSLELLLEEYNNLKNNR